MRMDAQQVIAQLGGFRRLKAMVNARAFGRDENSVSFKFSGSRVANYCRITLDPMDTYTVEFLKVRANKVKVVDTTEGAYADMLVPLFEKTTKLYLSL